MPILQASTLCSVAIGPVAALGGSLACIRWVAPRGWLDHPDPRKHHHAPTPRTAGLALWLPLMGLLALGRCPLPLDPVAGLLNQSGVLWFRATAAGFP